MNNSKSELNVKTFWQQLPWMLRGSLIVALLFVIAVAAAHIVFFSLRLGKGLSESHAEWAQFGDYFGGVLNPLLGFITFFSLLVTIVLQIQALQAALKQTQQAEEAGREQTGILQEQLRLARVETFEASFHSYLRIYQDFVHRNRAKLDSLFQEVNSQTNYDPNVERAFQLTLFQFASYFRGFFNLMRSYQIPDQTP